MAPCVQLAHELGVHAIVSVFSVELVPIAETLPWDAYKTASPDIINKPLLDALAGTGKPLIISTGASTLEEVKRAVEWLKPIHDRMAVLQCVSSYPTAIEDSAMDAMLELGECFPGAVGYSDHTSSEWSGSLATICGAELLEKHFTYDRKARGPDHAASLNSSMMQVYCGSVRDGWPRFRVRNHAPTICRPNRDEIRAALAESDAPELLRRPAFVKRVLPIEQDVRTVSRQSLTTIRDLPAGHILARADLTIKRPGTGIPPYELDATIGRRLTRAIEADMPLMKGDLS
jgi:sialic acid synthase SpsE